MLKVSKLLVTSLFTTLLAFPSTLKAEEHSLIGINYPPLPEEVEEIGGWVTEKPYIIDRVSIHGQKFLLLSRLIERDSKGKASYRVVNILPLPIINFETEELLGGPLCFVNGKEALNMIFIAKSSENQPYLTKASKAWRVEGENFVEINPQSVNFQCENLSYGL